MMKFSRFKKHNLIIFITCIILIIVLLNCIYIYHYYNNFNLNNIITHIIIEIDIIIKNISAFFEFFAKEFINKDIIKLLIIVGTIIYITSTGKLFENILKIIKSINSIELSGFKISMNKLEENIKEESKKINNYDKKSNLTTEERENKEKAELKKSIFEAFINSPGLAELINNTIKPKYKCFKIPLNKIPNNLRYNDINFIFQTDINNGILIIKDIKSDIRDVVIEVFDDLLSQGIIY